MFYDTIFVFRALEEDGWRHESGCGAAFDAVLVEAYNGQPGGAPTPPLTPAGFTTCLLDVHGVATICEEGCGHLLLDGIEGVASVSVHLPRPDGSSLCPALIGTVTVLFADE